MKVEKASKRFMRKQTKKDFGFWMIELVFLIDFFADKTGLDEFKGLLYCLFLITVLFIFSNHVESLISEFLFTKLLKYENELLKIYHRHQNQYRIIIV